MQELQELKKKLNEMKHTNRKWKMSRKSKYPKVWRKIMENWISPAQQEIDYTPEELEKIKAMKPNKQKLDKQRIPRKRKNQ